MTFRRNSFDAEMRIALRKWRGSPDDGELARKLVFALDRAGALPDSGPAQPAATRVPVPLRRIGANATEVDNGESRVLVSYSTPVAFLTRNSRIAFVIDHVQSRTTAKHISQWLASNGITHTEPVPAGDIVAAMSPSPPRQRP